MADKSFLEDCKDENQACGSHYKKYLIEPWFFIRYNNLSAFQSQVIKYVTRVDDKDTPEQNIEKIMDYCQKELKIRKVLRNLKNGNSA